MNKQGFFLVEALVALVMLTLIITTVAHYQAQGFSWIHEMRSALQAEELAHKEFAHFNMNRRLPSEHANGNFKVHWQKSAIEPYASRAYTYLNEPPHFYRMKVCVTWPTIAGVTRTLTMPYAGTVL